MMSATVESRLSKYAWIFISCARITKTSQCCRAVESRLVTITRDHGPCFSRSRTTPYLSILPLTSDVSAAAVTIDALKSDIETSRLNNDVRRFTMLTNGVLHFHTLCFPDLSSGAVKPGTHWQQHRLSPIQSTMLPIRSTWSQVYETKATRSTLSTWPCRIQLCRQCVPGLRLLLSKNCQKTFSD